MQLFSSLPNRLVIAVLTLLVVIACSQGDVPEVAPTTIEIASTPTPVQPNPSPTSTQSPRSVTPTASPTFTVPTATPERPVPSVTPGMALPELQLEEAQIAQCRLSGDIGRSGLSGNGTAAAPTPTPVVIGTSRDPDLVASDLAVFRKGVDPILSTLVEYDANFRESWSSADTVGMQAALLHAVGNKLAQLCSAASQLSVPQEILGEMVGFAESIRVRHAWTEIALEELLCCGDAHTTKMRIGLNSTTLVISEATSSLSNFLDEHEIARDSDSDRVFLNELFGLTMLIGSESIVVRNGVDLLVAYVDAASLDPTSLGPAGWNDGSAIRIRRLRNRTEVSVDEAVAEQSGFVDRFGDVRRIDEFDNPNIDEVHFEYLQLIDGWEGSMTVFVGDGFTYMIEAMCHQDVPAACGSVRASVESVALTN